MALLRILSKRLRRQSIHDSGILVANQTGHTNAGAYGTAGLPFALRWTGVWYCLVAFLSLTGAMAASESSAGGPGGKSHYRSGSHRQSAANVKTDATTQDAENDAVGGFSLGSLLGRKDSRDSDQLELLSTLPMDRLTPQAKQKLDAITEKPSLYRQLPTQAIRCDKELFLFLTRKPESIIGIWDLMGITKVQTDRLGPYKLKAVDGCGTTCEIDLLYGDQNLHVFMADGMYDGKFTQQPIHGKGLFVFKSTYAVSSDGSTTVNGTLDCYIKFESLGADLITRSLGGLIGRSADHNFVETARFISQISQACEVNPNAMLDMVDRMPQVDAQTKVEFSRVILNVSRRFRARATPAAKLVREVGITETSR